MSSPIKNSTILKEKLEKIQHEAFEIYPFQFMGSFFSHTLRLIKRLEKIESSIKHSMDVERFNQELITLQRKYENIDKSLSIAELNRESCSADYNKLKRDEQKIRKELLNYYSVSAQLASGINDSFRLTNEAMDIIMEKRKHNTIIALDMAFRAANCLTGHSDFLDNKKTNEKQKSAIKRWTPKKQVQEYATELYLEKQWRSPLNAAKSLADQICDYAKENTDFRFSHDKHQAIDTIAKWFRQI